MGTLVDSRNTHYEALNMALKNVDPRYVINYSEHLAIYDGLPTKTKLEILSKTKGIDSNLHSKIWKLKQKYTCDLIENYTPDPHIIEALKELKEQGYLIYIASNCVWKNLLMICLKKGLLPYLDWLISNEEVKYCKPSPEIYFKCIEHANLGVEKVLIVEDSPVGLRSAYSSGASVLQVSDPSEINASKILNRIREINTPPMNIPYSKSCNVVIPMAGNGSRFVKAGYTFPKPLIEVNYKNKKLCMIELVVKNLNLDFNKARFIFIVQKEHYEKYDLQNFLNRIAPGCIIIPLNHVTEGAACTVLKAKDYINNDTRLIVANSDQYVDWNANSFFYQTENSDGGIATFESINPKWSFVKLDSEGFVEEVAEKKVISNRATVGIYTYKNGSDFVKYAESMIEKNIRVNNEFYVCPIFNEMVKDKKKVKIVDVEKMWGLGVPEDLEFFNANYS